jgi:D-alanyl-D-alanine carboxypeptidase
MNGGRILYAQSPDTPRGPASLTKMMTLYILFSYLRAGAIGLDSEIVVTPHAANQPPTKLGLKPDQTISTLDAIKGLVTQSANDAAVTVAENLAGTEENFARLMTTKARSLGLSSTTFRNASGLAAPDQVTTARDMAVLAQHLIRDYPEYYSVFSAKYFIYHGRRYRNHNHLLFGYRGTDGIKTGYTRASGYNLVASVRRDDKHVVAVVLGGSTGGQRDAAMRALIDKHLPLAVAGNSASPPVLAKPAPPSPPAAPEVTGSAFVMPGARPAAAAPVTPVHAEASSPVVVPAVAGSRAGPFHVQVGAFTSEAEAEARLDQVKARAAKLFDGHKPLTVTFHKDDTQWYRARFAGFSQDDAKSTCAAVKRLGLECAVMPAN